MLMMADDDSIDLHSSGLDKLVTVSSMHSSLEELIPLVAVTLSLLMPVLIVLIIMAYRTRQQRMRYEVMIRLVDRGQTVPPEFFEDPARRRRSDLSGGLSLIAVGIGLAVGFWVAGGGEASGFALIPFFVGSARLISFVMERRDSQSPQFPHYP